MHPFRDEIQEYLQERLQENFFVHIERDGEDWILSATRKNPPLTFFLKLEDIPPVLFDEIKEAFVLFFEKPLSIVHKWTPTKIQDYNCYYKVSREDLELTLEADKLIKNS